MKIKNKLLTVITIVVFFLIVAAVFIGAVLIYPASNSIYETPLKINN